MINRYAWELGRCLTLLCVLGLTTHGWGGGSTPFIRGRVNTDAGFNIADTVYLLAFLTGQGDLTCLDAADVNDDGAVNIVDPVYTLHVFFAAHAPPPAPFPSCGLDPTPDGLGCDSFNTCP